MPKLVDYTDFSEYESKVYLSLLILGSSGARKLSLHCRVPRTKVYRTLRKLIDNGLVVKILGSPKVFTPSNPAEAFEALLDDFRRRALVFDEDYRTPPPPKLPETRPPLLETLRVLATTNG